MASWVLLRGLMREARHWGQFAPHLQQVLAAEQVLTPDFPGNGKLFAVDSCNTVPAMAQALRQQLQLAGQRPPYRVLALSLGAMVGVAWANAYPEEIEKLVLINTSLAPHNPFYHRLRPQNYAHLLWLLLHHSPLQQEKLILRLTSNLQDGAQKQELLQNWLDYARSCPVSRANILRQLQAAMRFRAPAAAPAVPLLMLAGAQDHLVDVRCSQTLAQRWHCPLLLHPRAGHDLPLDDAPWVLQQLQHWLQGQ